MTGRVTRACDGCRVRKVRCSGSQPCSQCDHLSLRCVFAPPNGKRKPGVRGRLVAQLRNQSSGDQTSGDQASDGQTGANKPATLSSSHDNRLSNESPDSASSPNSGPSSVAALSITSIASILDPNPSHCDGVPLGHDAAADAAGYTPDFFTKLLPLFEQHVYPLNPVIPPDEIGVAIGNMHGSSEDAALVYAFAAVTINLTQLSWDSKGDVASQLTSLMQRSLEAHRRAELGPMRNGALLGELTVTVKRIMTCIFLEICMMAFRRFERSFIILREAIAMIQVLNVHQHSLGESSLDPCEVRRRQRMYWEAYIHERFLSTVTGFPCIMTPLRTGLPYVDSTIAVHVDVGFNRLICLFRIIDQSFLNYWSAQEYLTPDDQPEMTAQWVESKQAQLDQDEAGAAEAERALAAGGRGNLTGLQLADLFVTRLWLRTLIWQLALSRGLLRSTPPENAHEGLSLHFPAHRLTSQLRNLVSRIQSVVSIANHGSGMLQKLFEITSTVADVLALPLALGQGQTHEEAMARMEDFFFWVKFLFSFERIQREQKDYLREKLHVLQEMYPAVNFGNLTGANAD